MSTVVGITITSPHSYRGLVLVRLTVDTLLLIITGLIPIHGHYVMHVHTNIIISTVLCLPILLLHSNVPFSSQPGHRGMYVQDFHQVS